MLGVALTPAVAPRRGPVVALEEKATSPRDAGPPPDYPAERAALRDRLTAALAQALDREALIRAVGRPIGDTTSSFSHGVLEWAKLGPRPGRPAASLPDTTGRGVMCWRDPDPDMLSRNLLCVVWLPHHATIFEAVILRERRGRR